LARLLEVLVWCLFASDAGADVVMPAPDVATRVIVRASADSQSAQIGSLEPGEQLELVGSVPYWYEVRLSATTTGFVSKRWTQAIPTATPPTPHPPPPGPTFTLDIVDVGTGLAVLLRGADFTLVYDAGSNDDLARGTGNRMLAYVRHVAPDLTTIDHMVLSHPHRDHVELLPDLLATYTVREVWDSGRVNDICGYRAFLTAVRDEVGLQYHNALQAFGFRDYPFVAKTCYGQALPAEQIRLNQASRINSGDTIPLGLGATMTILHADGAHHGSPNENSLVVRLDLGATRVLLMGDAEAGGRQSPSVPPAPDSIEGVLVACCTSDLASQVLIVGHHGSRTSSRTAFLDAVGASLFVVSSGPMQYGSVTLPDADVIAELTARGTVFRTDTADAACTTNPAKIGPDADGRAGGCHNVRIVIGGTPAVQASVFQASDTP
jgi:competence protein ComEC